MRRALGMLMIAGVSLLAVACGRDNALENPSTSSASAEKAVAEPQVAANANANAKPSDAVLVEGARPTRGNAAATSEHESRVAEARRAVDVTIYGASWCPSCKQTRAWLDAQGMAYRERDIDTSEDASRTARRLNPAGTIPVIDVEGEVVVGFAPEVLDRTIRRKAESKVN